MPEAHQHTVEAFFNRQRIIDPHYFFGREREIEALYSAVLTRQCRAIVGERKLGKSSLLTHIAHPDNQRQHGLNPEHYLFLYIDLEGMSNIAREEFWPEVVDRLALQLAPGELRDQFSTAALAGELRFMQVRRLLRRLSAAQVQLVLMLDEFESLATNPAFEPSFYGELRSLAGELGVTFITASKRSLYDVTYQHADTLSSPFFNIFSEVRLGLLPEAEALALLHGLSARTPRPFAEAQARALLALAGPHPFFLQIAGSYLEAALADGPAVNADPTPDNALWLACRRRFLAEAEDHYRYLWSQLEPAEQTALFRLHQLKPDELRPLQNKALVLEERAFAEGFAEFLARRKNLPEAPTPAIAATDDTDNLTGATLGNYRVLSLLGRGGMATVYQGYQASLDRYVAVKVMSSALQTDPQFVERFKREAETVAKLRHPNIVQMLDFGVQGRILYMVMEYINGLTLREHLRHTRQTSGKRLPPAELVYILTGLASALDYAHDHGLIHRDIKPANIMLRDEPHRAARGEIGYAPILTDFGVARMIERGAQTTSGGTIGTPDYMSPEQARGEPAGPPADVYALGIVAYEMLTGRLPFSAETPLAMLLQHLQTEPSSVQLHVPDVTPEVESVLRRALAKDPAQRFDHAGDFASALTRAYRVRPAL